MAGLRRGVAGIDWASKARSGWPPSRHWARIKAMAVVAARDDTPAELRERRRAAIHRAIAHWIAPDYQCTNWWYNEMGIPTLVGPTLLLWGEHAMAEKSSCAVDVSLARHLIARTGQNKIWPAGNALLCGLLRCREAEISEAAAVIWGEIAASREEGEERDVSCHRRGH